MSESKEVFFRASSFGNLMTENQGSVFTETMAEELENLYYELENGINKNGNKVKWTEAKADKLKNLVAKRDAPPQLSKTAKSEVEKIWRLNKKGFWEDLENKYLMKGLFNEVDGIDLVSKAHNSFYNKNQERIYKNNITGECDIIDVKYGKRIVIDVKSSWNPRTFMDGDLSKIYEFQLRCYMYLYDAEEAYLCYCLTDAPEHLVTNEKKKQWYKFYSDSMTQAEVELMETKLERIYKQIETNMVYSNNPNYSQEELVKTFKITRDLEIEKEMLAKIPLALKYYNSIKLNQV
jgi:hypothetical protein